MEGYNPYCPNKQISRTSSYPNIDSSGLQQHPIHFSQMLSSFKIERQFQILPWGIGSNHLDTESMGGENSHKFLHLQVPPAKESSEFSVTPAVGTLERKQVQIPCRGQFEKWCQGRRQYFLTCVGRFSLSLNNNYKKITREMCRQKNNPQRCHSLSTCYVIWRGRIKVVSGIRF